MSHDTLGDIATYLRDSGHRLRVHFAAGRYVASLTDIHGGCLAIGTHAQIETAVATCVADYERRKVKAS